MREGSHRPGGRCRQASAVSFALALVFGEGAVLSPRPSPPVVEPVEEIALPFLDESDSLVRNLVAALTSHPAFAAWLIPCRLRRLPRAAKGWMGPRGASSAGRRSRRR